MEHARRIELRSFFRSAVEQNLLPFWRRALDRDRGGVFTCFSNDGERLVSRDKFTWSQGRFVWIWSRLAQAGSGGLISVEPEPFLEQAERTLRFLQRHAFLENGNAVFVLSEEGQWKEPAPGAGYDTSIYADCFVAMGAAEFARATGRPGELEFAIKLFARIEARVSSGQFRSDPDAIPPGYRSHAVAMIGLNVAVVLAEAAEQLGHPAAPALRARATQGAREVLDGFHQGAGRLCEFVPARGGLQENLLCRHMNPGHALESMWLVLRAAEAGGFSHARKPSLEVMRRAFGIGWDSDFGGLLHYADWEGGAPRGSREDSHYEEAVGRSWDDKLWWVHAEAIYASLLAHQLTAEGEWLSWLDRVLAYTFRTFPHPDPSVGEWIQIRNRRGIPVDKVVALPVKDPYHILRNLVLSIELLTER